MYSTVPSKSLGAIFKIDNFYILRIPSNPMQFYQFSAKTGAGYQIIRIEDQAPHFMGPDLNPYCLRRSFKINTFLKIVENVFILFQSFWRALYIIYLLFISYKIVKGFLAISFLLPVISSLNFHDVCQCFYITRNKISDWSDKRQRFSP